MKDDKQEISAGTIIFRNDSVKGPQVLLLRTYDKYDLPKGHVEPTDTDIFSAAARETAEECSFAVVNDPYFELTPSEPVAKILHGVTSPITCNNINSKTGVIKKTVLLFPVETKCSNVAILPNKKTGIYEHQGYAWVSTGGIRDSKLHKYLQDGVNSAIQQYNTHLVVENAIKRLKSV